MWPLRRTGTPGPSLYLLFPLKPILLLPLLSSPNDSAAQILQSHFSTFLFSYKYLCPGAEKIPRTFHSAAPAVPAECRLSAFKVVIPGGKMRKFSTALLSQATKKPKQSKTSACGPFASHPARQSALSFVTARSSFSVLCFVSLPLSAAAETGSVAIPRVQTVREAARKAWRAAGETIHPPSRCQLTHCPCLSSLSPFCLFVHILSFSNPERVVNPNMCLQTCEEKI